jgi:hypothetical protein
MRSVILGICGWVITAGAAELEVQVRLQDYANVPSVWLTKAKGVASGILANAGVRVRWAECSPNSGAADPVCNIPPGPTDLYVRILTKEMAKRARTTNHCMGYAMVSGRFPTIASAFYHRAVELEAGRSGARAEILGGILAHEIGHLLLAENSHSETGVLRAEWGDEELRTIARGRLWFTGEQASRMASLGRDRLRAAESLAKVRPVKAGME